MNAKAVFLQIIICIAVAMPIEAQTGKVVISFNGIDGFGPTYLLQGPDGNLYGVTTLGGSNNVGTVFKITSHGLSTIHSFNNTDGAYPFGILALGMDGSLYGTTEGETGLGTIFKITPAGTFRTLHTFAGTDGAMPFGGLVLASDGNFYGTTAEGGNLTCASPYGCGTVFRMTPSGTVATLYKFSGVDGLEPRAGLVQSSDGGFYGTTMGGGNPICSANGGCGTVFKITSKGAFATLHAFDGYDGAEPFTGPLVQSTDNNFYGITLGGGSNDGGTVFSISPLGVFTSLYNFCIDPNCADGVEPFAGLIQATDGNFFGTTDGYKGTLFMITPTGVLTTLHQFGRSGNAPYGLLQATSSLFYGTTQAGGIYSDGTLFVFDMGLDPFVSFVRNSGREATAVGILGQGFNGASNVAFNGISASFTVKLDSFLIATVPVAATSGYVTVTTPTGVLTSNVPFHVIP